MEQPFEISWTWSRRTQPHPKGGFDGEERVFLSFRHFLTLHQGSFAVRVGSSAAQLFLDPDLSTIFRELADVLDLLRHDTNEPAELYFFEQGTELVLWMERRSGDISVRFETFPGSGEPYKDLSERPVVVPASLFFGQWARFMAAVLDAVCALDPDLAADESQQRYRRRVSGGEASRAPPPSASDGLRAARTEAERLPGSDPLTARDYTSQSSMRTPCSRRGPDDEVTLIVGSAPDGHVVSACPRPRSKPPP